MKACLSLPILCLLAVPAAADVHVRFIEGAPKDRFVVSNEGSCDLPALTVTLDLDQAAGGIIFDVSSRGAGVEVYQPFEIVTGAALLNGAPSIADGDSAVTLQLIGLAAGEAFGFTIDVDDTGGGREITVAQDEIRGAVVAITTPAGTATGRFEDRARAVVAVTDCVA